jgi:alkanesulfonate monooxygenase SsuD/methylene tetrahydromethanopterin reductase-like flavin-dependent oxidoreductase (luciferase family)
MSTVVNVCWRNNPLLLAKQLASVARLSGGRFTAGLGMGAWPADYQASGVPLAGRGARFETALAAMDRTWDASAGRPKILLGGDDFFADARADTATDPEQLRAVLRRLSNAGCDHVVPFPCSGDPQQVELLAGALGRDGADPDERPQ